MARIIKANSIPPGGAGEAGVMNLADIAAEARAVILDARKDAARIVSEARAMADTVCDQAAEKGYAEGFARGQNDGYADGHKQGLAEAKDELADRAEELIDLTEKVLRELSTARAELLHRGRCEMLDFALDLAAKIVGRVAARDAGAARENLRKALELADCAQELCVKVNPSQLDDLRASVPKFTEALGRTGEVRLVGDAEVSPGGVKLFSPQGEIDATIETQLSNIVEALLGCCAGDARLAARRGIRTDREHYQPVEGAARQEISERSLLLEDGPLQETPPGGVRHDARPAEDERTTAEKP
jgi:flagellar assembly protein FliH